MVEGTAIYPEEVLEKIRQETLQMISWNMLVTINKAKVLIGAKWRLLSPVSQEALVAREIMLSILDSRNRELDPLKDRIRHTMIHAGIEGWGTRPGEDLIPLEDPKTLGKASLREARR